jgi:quercetin dioxygenase-like cupin family protein
MRNIAMPLVLGLLIGVGGGAFLHAQQPGPKVTVMQRGDAVDIPGHEVRMSVIEAAPNTPIGRHTHFGTEVAYIMEGSGTLRVEGQPPRELKAGDTFMVEAGKPHGGMSGPTGLKAVAFHVVEKGKPFLTPAP